eukprot:g35277.t1
MHRPAGGLQLQVKATVRSENHLRSIEVVHDFYRTAGGSYCTEAIRSRCRPRTAGLTRVMNFRQSKDDFLVGRGRLRAGR